jgi:multidrug efflux pump subunit AcrA (membrane-fusion protein)
VRTDVVSRQAVGGMIGYAATVAVSAPSGTASGALVQARSAVDLAAAQVAGARQAVADARLLAARQAEAARGAVDAAQAAVNADLQRSDQPALVRDQPALGSAQAQLAAAEASGREHLDQSQAGLAAAQAQLSGGQRALAQAAETALVDGSSYTWLAPAGSVIERGQPLYEISGRPVPLLYGGRPAWRRLAPGVRGPDVQQLEDNLVALGFATGTSLAVDGNFTEADAAAVRRWQASLGVEQTGVVDLGAAVFLPAAVRVISLHSAAGSPVQPGTAILDVSSTEKVVTVQLDTAYEQLVRAGDAVSITLPDNRTTTTGTVRDVGRVASTPGAQGNQGSQGGPPARPSVPVSIAVADQAALARYDQAPVRVSITDQVRRQVLAVPITALLAQGDGGYAVRVVRGAAGHLLRVEVGVFGDDGLVEVTGEGLRAGLRIQVPAA